MSTAKDWKVLGPYSGGCEQSACLTEYDCVDLTAATEQFSAYTRNYCGVGTRRKLHSVSEANPPDNSLTLRGTDEFMTNVLRQIAKNGCATSLQRVHCSGRGEAYRMVQWTSITPQGALTASGPAATDDPQTSTADGIYSDKFVWKAPGDSVPPLTLTNSGQYKDIAPVGMADGSNVIFTVDPAPDESYPFTVTVNGMEAVLGTDYTLNGATITFAEAPACDAEILVSYYSAEFAIFGLEPVAVWFCGAPQCFTGSECGKGCNDGCSRMHAIFNTTLTVTNDCGDTLGNRVAIATYRVSSAMGDQSIELLDVDVLDSAILDAKDALCTSSGETIISTESGIYVTCGSSFVSESAPLPNGKSFGKLAFSELNDETYVLYGDSGVMKRGNGRWVVVLRDGQNVVGVQSHIAAAGNGVITGGEFGSFQTSSDRGRQWRVSQIVGAGDAYSVAAGVANELSAGSPTFYALTFDPLAQIATTKLHIFDGYTWSQRKSWAQAITNNADVVAAVDDWFLYVRIDNTLYRNTNRGCDKCEAWAEITNSSAPLRSHLAVCANDPQRTAMVGTGGSVAMAGDNFYTSGQDETATHVVLDNDLVPDGCTIDVTSVVVTAGPSQGTATPNPDGTVTYVSGATAVGFDTYDYEVAYTCVDGTSGTLSATVRIDFLS